MIDGSSFSGLLTRVEIEHIRIGPAENVDPQISIGDKEYHPISAEGETVVLNLHDPC
jgi:hypothetical protein